MEVKPLIAPQELAALKEKESVVILDTRSAEEYATSYRLESVLTKVQMGLVL